MSAVLSGKSRESPEQTEVIASDPCQIVIKDEKTGERRICGAIKRSLHAHLKAHKKNGKPWTVTEYRKKFPKFSLGTPQYTPPKEQQEKFLQSSPNYRAQKAVHDERAAADDVQATTDTSEITKRFEEIWNEVNRDVAARQFAFEAARCEHRLKELNDRYDKQFRQGGKNVDYKALSDIQRQIDDQREALIELMKFLGQSVKERREKNQLGNDTVAQLVSNFGATLRRMSPERREIFANRVRDVKMAMQQRIRDKKLAELTSTDIAEMEEAPKQMTGTDIDARINAFVNRVEV